MLFVLPATNELGNSYSPSHHPIITTTLAAVARENGAEVKIIDAVVTGDSYAKVQKKIQDFQPDWIGIIPFEYRREMEISSILQFVSFLRHHKISSTIGLLNCPINEQTCKNALGNVDFIYWGDSESAVKRYATHQDFTENGVSYFVHGEVQEHPISEHIDWSVLSTPAWDLCDISAYIPSAHRYIDLPVLPVMTTRSCPFGCDFCPHSLFHTSEEYMIRPAKDVLIEIQELQQKYGVTNIEFYDPTFGINKDHTLEICRGLQIMKEQGNPITWSCYTRCDLLSKEMLIEMKKAGCHTVLFGVESGNTEVLARTKKQLQLKDVRLFIQNCHDIGLQTIASFILGLPLDTPSTIRQTIHFACEVDPTFAQFHPARIFFAHKEWQDLGTFGDIWDETPSSINGISYIPNRLTQGSLYWYLFRSYVQFYLRPKKLRHIIGNIDSRNDVKRYLLGAKQIALHLRELQINREQQ